MTVVRISDWLIANSKACPECKSMDYHKVWSGESDIYVMSCWSCEHEEEHPVW